MISIVTKRNRSLIMKMTSSSLSRNLTSSASKHNAIVCHNKEGWQKLTYEQVETPEPDDFDVLIRVGAAGLNYPDVLICEGKYQMQPPYPFSPGGECAGTIVKTGSSVSKFKVGDRVLTLPGYGCFQEKITANEDKCILLPSFMPTEVAAGFLYTYGTTIHALKDRAELKPDETVLILGASGGVGVAAIEIAKAMGAKVIAAASTPEKLQVCKQFGADYLINYTTEKLKDRIMEITKGNGVNVVYDAVGGTHSEPSLRSIAWRGRYLVIGFVGGIPKIPLNLTLLKGCSIIGVFWGMFTAREPANFEADVKQLFQWYGEKKLKPTTTAKFPLRDAPAAIGEMAQRKVVGKAIVICDGVQGKL
jgi:NADPH2:quinone reductase